MDKERLRISWRKSREKNKEVRREYEKLRKQKVRMVVLAHYSVGTLGCVVCREDRLDCLSIDHVGNNGASHKRETGCGSGSNLYRWLSKNNYPEGFQTLCMNCQAIKEAARRRTAQKVNLPE